MDFLTFIKQYWFLIIIAIAIISDITIIVYQWLKKPTEEQLNKVKEWLVFAVADAEKHLGTGTGQMKLRYVYDMFVTKFPAIAVFLSFEQFSKMVDGALDKFNELIKTNNNIKDFYIEQTATPIEQEEVQKDEEI